MLPSLPLSRCQNGHVQSCPPSHLILVGFLAVGNIPMKERGINAHSAIRLDGWMAENLHVKVSVHLRVLHLLPNLGTDHIDLLLRVAQLAREKSIGEGFEAFHDLEVIPGADLLLR